VPDDAVVISPRELPGLPDERAAFEAAARAPIGARPLRELAKPTDTIAVVIADITRPSPSERLVPWIGAELAHVPRQNFVIVNGTGSQRANTREDLTQMLGAAVDSELVPNASVIVWRNGSARAAHRGGILTLVHELGLNSSGSLRI
jgi:hypothetical protein